MKGSLSSSSSHFILRYFLLIFLSLHSAALASQLSTDDLKSLVINNGTLWNRGHSLPSCSNAQVKWERTVVRPSEGSHRAVTTSITVPDSSLLQSVVVADFVPKRAFVDINQMKLAGVDIEIFTEGGKREFDIEAPSWSSAAEAGVVFTALRPPYDSTEAELILNVHIRYQNFTEAGGMCDEFVALDTPKLFVVCESESGESKSVEVREIKPESEPEKLAVEVSIGAMNVSDNVALVTFVFAILGALLIVVASFV